MMNHHGEQKVVLILLSALFFISCNGKDSTGLEDGGKHEFEDGGKHEFALPTDALVSDIGSPDMSPPSKTEWVAMDEGHSMGSSWAMGVAMYKSSDIFAVGSFKGTMSLGGKYYASKGLMRDMFWIWLSNTGSFKTFQQAGGTDARGNGVALDDSGNVIVVGDFSDTIAFSDKAKLKSTGHYDMFIAKYTPTGKVLWAVSAGGTYVGPGTDTANCVATGLSGDIFISGIIYESAVFGDIKLKSSGKDKFDSFVAKLDKNGKFKWVVRLDKSVSDSPLSLASDSKGNCYVSGDIHSSATMGTTKITGDMFVTKISPNGNFDWAVSGTAAVSSCMGGTVDSAGSSYITGDLEGKGTFGSIAINSNGPASGFMAKVSPTGKFLWARSFGTGSSGPIYTQPQRIAVDSVGNSYVLGRFSGKAVFGPYTLKATTGRNTFVAKVSPVGKVLWAAPGGNSTSFNGGITVDTKQNAYIAGSFEGKANFGGMAKSSSKDTFFVWKLASGNP